MGSSMLIQQHFLLVERPDSFGIIRRVLLLPFRFGIRHITCTEMAYVLKVAKMCMPEEQKSFEKILPADTSALFRFRVCASE